MRYLLFILVVVLLLAQMACENDFERNYPEHKIVLTNNIGELTINLSPEFDTLYKIEAGNDYQYGSYQFYIIQPKSFQAPKSFSYFGFNNVFPDSVNKFWIRHKFYRACDFETTGFNIDSTMNARELFYEHIEPGKKFPPWEKKFINGLEFVISKSIDSSNGKAPTYNLCASTYFNSSIIDMGFSKEVKRYNNNSDFISECDKMLQTVKLK